ncbi:hypothetical protein NMG60_11014110 [Bertholletia excelsa]
MKQRELLEFRTPQHPSLGTNNWGGASPLLARNIPKESLEQRYARLNSIRTRDEIFPAHDGDSTFFPHYETKRKCPPGTGRKGLLFLLVRRPWKKEEKITLGSSLKKRRWLPRLDPRNRWPQGWC